MADMPRTTRRPHMEVTVERSTTMSIRWHVTAPRHFLFQVVWLLIVVLFLGELKAEAAREPVPVPELALWESHMVDFGKQHCVTLSNPEPLEGFPSQTDYDAERVFYQMANYTSDPSWKFCAHLAEALYRDL